jgi:hypothetical protein
MPTTTRTVGAVGAVLIAGACLAATAPAAPAPVKPGYVGVWVQKSWALGGMVLPCPVNVPLPPAAPPISCGPQTYLKLFPNGRYETDIPSFARYSAHRGQFAVVPFAGGPAIVFDDDGARDEPRSYRMSLGKAGKKAPRSMAISASMNMAGGAEQVFTMNFVRYAK